MRAFEIAKDIAALEVLFNRALAAGVAGEPLTALAECRNECMRQLELLGLSAHERAELVHLFRSATQAGAEVPLDKEPTGITPGMNALLQQSGIHADCLSTFIRAVLSAFRGKATPEAKRWLPGGDQFEEVQRQRERWGNDRFTYNDAYEFPPEVAKAVLDYYKNEEREQTEAHARMLKFVQGTFHERSYAS